MSKGGTYIRFRRGATGKSGVHVEYIGRDSAVLEREDGTLLRNMPEEVERAESYRELRTNVASTLGRARSRRSPGIGRAASRARTSA